MRITGSGANVRTGDGGAVAMSAGAMMSALSSLLPSAEQLQELQEVLRQLHYDDQQELSYDKVSDPGGTGLGDNSR